MEGFYTPDLAMANVKPGALLRVVNKEYNPDKDMVWWDFEVIGQMNEVFAKGENYYLSYLAYPDEYLQAMDRTLCSVMDKDDEGVGKAETALCIEEPWKCLILYGDHREGYKPIANDLEACKKYWSDHQDQIGHTSDHLDEEA